VEDPMKKLVLAAMMSTMLLGSIFSMSILDTFLYQEFKDDLSKVSFKVIDKNDNAMLIIIDGVTYIYKIK
jgi:hypothetical protein